MTAWVKFGSIRRNEEEEPIISTSALYPLKHLHVCILPLAHFINTVASCISVYLFHNDGIQYVKRHSVAGALIQ